MSRILLVNDEESLREALGCLLSQAEFSVEFAADGDERNEAPLNFVSLRSLAHGVGSGALSERASFWSRQQCQSSTQKAVN